MSNPIPDQWSEQWTLGSDTSPKVITSTVAITGPSIYGQQEVEVVPKLEAEQKIEQLRAALSAPQEEGEGRTRIDAEDLAEAQRDPKVHQLQEDAQRYGRELGDRDHSVPLTKEQREQAEIAGQAAGQCPYCEGEMDGFGGVHMNDCPLVQQPADQQSEGEGKSSGVEAAVELAAEALWNEREHRDPSGDPVEGWCPPGHESDRQDPPREPLLWEQAVSEGKYEGDLEEFRADARAVVTALGPFPIRPDSDDRRGQ